MLYSFRDVLYSFRDVLYSCRDMIGRTCQDGAEKPGDEKGRHAKLSDCVEIQIEQQLPVVSPY